MTISKTPRHDYRLGGRFAKQPPPADAFPDVAMQEAARIQRAMSTDMPVMPIEQSPGERMYSVGVRARLGLKPAEPMPEPIERETWRDVWADVRGVVLCAAFVLTVLAFGAHVAGLWGA